MIREAAQQIILCPQRRLTASGVAKSCLTQGFFVNREMMHQLVQAVESCQASFCQQTPGVCLRRRFFLVHGRQVGQTTAKRYERFKIFHHKV